MEVRLVQYMKIFIQLLTQENHLMQTFHGTGNYSSAIGIANTYNGKEIHDTSEGVVGLCSRAVIKTGVNTNSFTETVQNNWMCIEMFGRWGTFQGTYITNLKLLFSDGTTTTIAEAVQNGFVEPLVLCGSDNETYAFSNVMNVLNGEPTENKTYPMCDILLKVTKIKSLKGISFETNQHWAANGLDGLRIKKFDDLELSTEPF